MSRKGKETSIEVRNLIIHHFEQGLTEIEIADIVQRPRTTVHYIIKKFKCGNSVENKPRTGRPLKLSSNNQRWIVRQIKKNPKTNASVLAKNTEQYMGIKVTPQTIRNVLKSNNFHARSARKKPHISKRNRKLRLEFARTYVTKSQEFWMDVIFADESKFNLFGCDGKVLVYRKPNTELEERNMVPTVKHGGGGVLVWGCMAASGVGNLVFINGLMDHIYYINLLKENLRAGADLGQHFQFYQDNDPKHTAINTRLWLLYNCPKVIKTPAQSPDLNPIEHLWGHLEKKLRAHTFTNRNQMKTALLESWGNIDPEYTKTLVKSMPDRLREVIRRKGKATKY